VPRELAKTVLPPYIIEPPDILLIETVTEGLPKEQRIGGSHLVRPDGTVGLGMYGSASVAGLTLDQAREAIADAIWRSQPELKERPNPKKIFVDVLAYNSKVYYIITDGGGYGEQVYRFAITGNETVLDALSWINGLPAVASKKHIWVARRVPDHGGAANILPVDWISITQDGSAATNYQILPGDRIYVHSQKIISFDNNLAKIIAPIERVLGVTLLGSETVNSIRNRGVSGTTP
jgi:polysaccharide export outer membrane protein